MLGDEIQNFFGFKCISNHKTQNWVYSLCPEVATFEKDAMFQETLCKFTDMRRAD